MNRIRRWHLAILLVCALALHASDMAPKPAPKTRTDNVKETLHGVELTDPYRWLEDQNSPETRAWIDQQNEYTQSIIKDLPGRAEIKKRLAELLKIDVIGIPVERGGKYFLTKRAADQDLSILYMRNALKGEDVVLLDPHGLSADHTTSVNRLSLTLDGAWMTYGTRKGGEDELEIRIQDVATRQDLKEVWPKARYGGFSFKPDKSGVYYSLVTREGPRYKYHVMGTDPAGDKIIFGENLKFGSSVGGGVSQDGKWLLLVVSYGSSADQTEIYLQDLANNGPIKPVINDVKARFSPGIGGDKLFIQTNHEAPNGKIYVTDLKDPARENWKLILPESETPIQGYSLVGGKLCVSYLKDVKSQVRIFEPDGKHLRDIVFPSIGSVGGISGRWESNEAFYTFTSFHTPTTIYRYDMAKGTSEEWSRLKVPVDTASLEVKQVWYESRDKTKIPMYIVHKKGLKLDGNNPTYLTGYGGFNLSQTPGFNSTAVLWAERGGVFAVPGLRGGGEFGEKWHKAGMFGNKQNVFDDFIAAAEWLIKNKYTSSARLAISGGSNGGLLVGAALTQRPELYRAVICSYPLLDMVRYHKFLLARYWVPEYGSSEDPAQFKYIHAYSPYHNVKPGTKYPAVMILTGDSDTRVDPLHGRKMAALLQASNGGDRPVLLHYDTKAGHSGGMAISRTIETSADQHSFLFWQLGAK